MKNYLILVCCLTLGCFNNKTSEKIDYHYANKGKTVDLFAAIRTCNIAELEALIRAGENPNSVMFERTLLAEAILRKNLEAVKTLIRLGAEVNRLMKYGITAIERAASAGNVEIVSELLAAGAKVNLRGAFINAAHAGHYEIVEMLFNYVHDANYSKECSWNALICAASKGHLKIVEFLIKHGADVNCKVLQNTPLSAAASNGHLAIVKLLAENGANIDLKIGEKTALLEAASYRSFEVAEYLLNIGATFTEKEGPILAYLAARRGSISGIDALIKKGAKINISPLETSYGQRYGQSYNPPLIEAARLGNIELVNFLLMNGADPNIRDQYHHTPLLRVIDACTVLFDKGKIKIAEMLISAGADVNASTKKSEPTTALNKAIHSCDFPMIKLLIDKGAIANDATFNLAIQQLSGYKKEFDEIIELLASKNANIVEFIKYSEINTILKVYNKIADLKTANGYRLFNIPSSKSETAIGVMLRELCNARKKLPCLYSKLLSCPTFIISDKSYDSLLKTFIKILSNENKKRVSITLRHAFQQEVVESIFEFMDYKADEGALDKLIEQLIIDNKEEEAIKYDIYKINSALASLRDCGRKSWRDCIIK